MNQLATLPANQREQLVAQQQQLTAQLKTLQFQLFDKTSPDVVEHINQLQLEKAKQQGILQQAQQQLAQLSPELENFDTGAEQILLEAISQQDWYSFKNKREIIFDKRTGDIYPNFQYIPHIKYGDWKKQQKEYAPSEIGKGKWQLLHEVFYYDQQKSKYTGFLNSKEKVDYAYGSFDYPFIYRGLKTVEIYMSRYRNTDGSLYRAYYYNKFAENGTNGRSEISGFNEDICIFPILKVIDNPDLLPDYPRLTAHEKTKIILDFFIEQDWIPNFELDYIKDEEEEAERLALVDKIYAAFLARYQIQKQLINLEQKIAKLHEPEPENLFTSDFDYRVEIQNYHLAEINASIWQYSLAAQQWINNLLAQIDSWENNHQHLLANALALNTTLTKKLPISLNLNATEQEILNTRHTDLQQRLNFSLEPLRSTLIDLLQQNQQIETTLQTTHSLTALAELEQQPRPSFTLLAEHTAKRCTQTLKKLEWLENSLDFVNSIVKSEQQSTENYLILLDKYQQDLLQIGVENSIESEEVSKWFAEWRQERLQILQQWQPLIQAGLNNLIPQHTVLDTLQCLEQYQQNLDKFYLGKRLGIHTTYAFQANGHRQEKLEKEQEITKLVHQFMQNLEKVIFSAKTTAQKIWLVRFSEVWQQGIVQEIIAFLSNEELLDRGDIAQIVSEEMRKIQQQSLAACLQDAKTYSAALTQQEKDFATLMFKMRKALQK
ncbi:hypothetical protein [Acinetobacter sp. 5862]|uniref:hypothetical protein n=1 Tax=Acinetobacter sp. 5862 TaxID=2967169 RepID=UPI002110F93A|nr:hypothetical protein [Acinetobacter sp. 5862]